MLRQPRYLRYRRCPQCGAVRRTWEVLVNPGPVLVPSQPERGKCPGCGHVGPLMAFQIAEQPETTK
jgi:hypothetical protein